MAVEDGKGHSTLQDAVNAAANNGSTVKLLKDVTENVTVSGSVTLDLSGKTIRGNIQNAENVTFVDATSTLKSEGKGRIYGEITGAPLTSLHNGRRYMLNAHESGEGKYYTVDRFYYSVEKVTQHSGGEMGFIANFAGNENVINAVKNGTFGFQFALVDNTKEPDANTEWTPSSTKTGTDMNLAAGYDGTNLNVIVKGVWEKSTNDILEGQTLFVRPVYEANGKTVAMNYRKAAMKNICTKLIEAANENMNDLQLAGLRTLYENHKELINGWEKAGDVTVPGILKNAQ